MKLGRLTFAILFLVSLSLALQRGYQGYGRQQYYQPGPTCLRVLLDPLQYTSSYADGSSFGWPLWRRLSQDYPKADNDCLIALRRLTHINSPRPERDRSR